VAKYFNNNLKYIRKKLNLSQDDVASRMNVDRATVSRWENGKMDVTLENAIDTARALNVPIVDFLCRDMTINDDVEFELFFEQNKDMLTNEDKIKITNIINERKRKNWWDVSVFLVSYFYMSFSKLCFKHFVRTTH